MQNHTIYPKEFNDHQIKNMKNVCFLIMGFGKETDDVYATIRTAAKKCNIECDRSDTLTISLPFFNKIVSSIIASYYIIVDISGLNPNVFYELGIAHTMRDAKNVLIIKDVKTKCPSDIQHLTYFQYNKNNLEELSKHVINFFNSTNYLDDLMSIFKVLDLLPNDLLDSEAIDSLDDTISEHCITVHSILTNSYSSINDEEINFCLFRLTDKYKNVFNTNKNLALFYKNLIVHLVNRLAKTRNLKSYIDTCFDLSKISINHPLYDLQVDLIITFLNTGYNDPRIYSWLKYYFSKSSPASLDLTRYRFEIALINNNYDCINKFLLDVLRNCIRENDQSALIEHSLNLCKEKKIFEALSPAFDILKKFDNPYQFRSAMDLITDLGTVKDVIEMLSLVNSRRSYLAKNTFINAHIEKANLRIETDKS